MKKFSKDPKLFKDLETELKIRGYSPQTIRMYLYENSKFLDFLNTKKLNVEFQSSLTEPRNRSSGNVTREDIRAYQAYLVSDKSLKPSTINLILSALRFYYVDVLGKEILYDIRRPKKEDKLPVVLSKEEVRQILGSIKNNKHRLLIELLYGSGLRVSEAVSLKIKDLNLKEKINIIRGGKGGKDRRIILPAKVRRKLSTYIKKRKDKNPFIFPYQDSHISARQAQRVVRNSALKAGLDKDVFCHALRSTFATHLLNSGVDIRDVQVLLGHERISTTQIYTKVSTERLKEIKSPLDKL